MTEEEFKAKVVQIHNEQFGDFTVEDDGIELVFSNDPVQKGKALYSYDILKDVATGHTYKVSLAHYGDYARGYDTYIRSIERVRPVQRIINDWMTVDTDVPEDSSVSYHRV